MTPPYRIAFCITSLDPGGAERALLEIVSRLDRDQFAIRVDSLDRSGLLADRFRDLNIPVQCWDAARWKLPARRRAINAAWRKWQPDLLQGFLFQGNIMVAATSRNVKTHSHQSPLRFAGVRVADRRGRWRGFLERLVASQYRTAVCVSQGVADHVRRLWGIPQKNIVVIPNGVSFERFATAKSTSRAEFGWTDRHRILINVGRLDRQKNHELLINSFGDLAATHSDAVLLLVGEGPERCRLEEQIQHRGLTDRVKFAGRRDDVPSLLKMADLFVLSSDWEGMPNVVLEALASGCPVVTTDVEGIHELIGDDDRGWVVPPADRLALTTACGDALAHENKSAVRIKAAGEFVRDLFSWDGIAERYACLYLSALSEVADSSDSRIPKI